MKKRLIIMTMMVAVATQFAIAQFYTGVRVGGTMGNISTPTIIDAVMPDFEYLPGIEAGVVSEYKISNQFSIQGEVNYREKGFRLREGMDINVFNIDLPLGVRVDTRLRYIDMPIMAKYAFGNGPVKAYVAAGPQMGYAMNGNIKTRANFLVDWNLTNTPINLDGLNHRRFEFGTVVGAGVEFETGAGHVFIDARYSQSLSDSFRVPLVDLNIKNHGFGFGVGYKVAI